MKVNRVSFIKIQEMNKFVISKTVSTDLGGLCFGIRFNCRAAPSRLDTRPKSNTKPYIANFDVFNRTYLFQRDRF